MNWAHIHLAVNHLPVLFLPVALAMLAAAQARKSAELRKAGLVWLVVAALAGAGAYLTGEPAEEVVEDRPGISDAAIEAHEEAAFGAVLATGAAGILALVVLVAGWGDHRPASGMFAATVAAALLAGALMARTANLGGHISHPEIRGPAAATVPPG
jgi:uncharacterized membrane protein